MGSESFGFNLVFTCAFGRRIVSLTRDRASAGRGSEATAIKTPLRFDVPEFVVRRPLVPGRLLATERTAHETPDFRKA